MGDEDLLAAIAADPDRAEPYLVYADVLQQRGDPRGELIVLQHALETATPAQELALRPREQDLFDAAGGRWLGKFEFTPRDVALRWRYGFVAGARVRHENALPRLWAIPFARATLVELTCETPPDDAMLGYLAHTPVRRLRLDPGDHEAIRDDITLRALDAMPQLEALAVRARSLALAWETPPATLRELSLDVDEGVVLAGPLPIERLVLESYTADPLAFLSVAGRFPRLRSLVLRTRFEPDSVRAVLERQPIHAQLEHVEILLGRPSPPRLDPELALWRSVVDARSRGATRAMFANLVDLAEHWIARGDGVQPLRFLERARAYYQTNGLWADELRALAALVAAAHARSDLEALDVHHREGTAIARAHQGPAVAAWETAVRTHVVDRRTYPVRDLVRRAEALRRKNEHVEALALLRQAEREARVRNEDRALVLGASARAHNDVGDYAGARRCCRDALPILRNAADRAGEVQQILALADAAIGEHAYDEARDHCEQALARLETVGDARSREPVRLRQAIVAALNADLERAATLLATSAEQASDETLGWIQVYHAVIAREPSLLELARVQLRGTSPQGEDAVAMADAVLRGDRRLPPPRSWHARILSRLADVTRA